MGSNLVVFHDNGAHLLDPILKKGFKHCFVVVDDGTYMIVVDGQMGLPHLQVIAGSDFDLKNFYVNEGFIVVEAPEGKAIRVPLVLSNCVGMAKTILGIRAWWVITPHQLYQRLTGS
jgi:hypothetical protein